MKILPEFYPYSKPKLNPIEWLLCALFPMEPLGSFHPKNDLPDILSYQYRLSRTVGEDPVNHVVQTRVVPRVTSTGVKYSLEGRYEEVGYPTTGDLQFPERSYKIAVYETPAETESLGGEIVAPEPTAEQISVEELEKCVGSSSTESNTGSPSVEVARRSWLAGVRLLPAMLKSWVSPKVPMSVGNGNERETEPSLPVA